ncbi:hypothetical protein K432DRAFT_401874 [Lepidopterella palustris CBS 459.81]|uniref:Uncharacterized protein n=1 Tax=Lepidopterella palustris CBS 459.81 TaxID=1314670 RepID=A0A8E2JIU1_9PEZI|nr:hypothetical protein K432DRAFT_401874 [Lepidopterella palustris CBS 459.81]
MSSHRWTLGMTVGRGDYDAQVWPHIAFLEIDGMEGGAGERKGVYRDVWRDMEGLERYLRMCWMHMVRYDAVMRECGVEPGWEGWVVRVVGQLWEVQTEYVEDEAGGWDVRFV